jgi:S-adenosylmethionine:tRNA ribosyltransferase-isomerase
LIPKIKISDYTYVLPDSKIAKYPLQSREDSKILIFENGLISDSKFSNLNEILPEKSIMVLNNTKVVPARLIFQKTGGAHIEILCLEPYSPAEYNQLFAQNKFCTWKCLIGNSKKWKEGYVYFYSNGNVELEKYVLKAKVVGKENDKTLVEFSWNGGIIFSDLMDKCGKVPIPPYLNREAEDLDTDRYQTLYAEIRGSIAAPTAGLHFSEDVFKKISKKGIEIENICLHVGAGTFIPVKSEFISDHDMHSELFTITKNTIENLINRGDKKIIAVGTTSTRTLESLYYIGVNCIEHKCIEPVKQWDPYNKTYKYSTNEALEALLEWMNKNKRDYIETKTGIIIVPGFQFRLVDVLITNFHQPKSTLLLLIAAFVGDYWRDIYNYALANNFRFLSYGDSSILFKSVAR